MLAIGLKVVWVDHVDVFKIGGSGLISEVDRVLEREIPDWEAFVFGIASTDSAFVVVIELRETGRHLSASWTWSGHDNDWSSGFNVFVSSKAFFGYDEWDVAWISGDLVVFVDLDSVVGELSDESVNKRKRLIEREDDTTYVELDFLICINKSFDFGLIGDSKVISDFVGIDIVGVDDDDNFNLVLHA